MRRGVCLVLLIVAAITAAAARADGPSSSTTTGTTTSTQTTTYEPLVPSALPGGCVGAGTAAIVAPGQAAVALGTPAATLAASDYPDPNPWLTFDSSVASGSDCGNEGVALTSLSLFGGAVTATTVGATDGTRMVTGLEIDGAPVTATTGQAVAVDGWGELTLGYSHGRLTAPLSLRLLQDYDGLPAGTTILVAFAAAPRPVAKPPRHHAPAHQVHRAKKKHHRSHAPQPLRVTPRLGLSPKHYVFPVDGGASYIDTYGADRSDIYDGWHHGDDLFAPLGTPLVAVATGKLTLIGWNALGGWRLWLTDSRGNSFYYAHLAAYSRYVLHHHRVKAGQVVGFLGRTGDAFTTTPHLHFEVHPHQLLKLGYDGAVDPTTYLHRWRVERLPANRIPRPARLVAPSGAPAQEAAVVWHQLLVARHLLPPTRPAIAFTAALRRPFPPAAVDEPTAPAPRRLTAVRLPSRVAAPPNDGPWPSVALGLLIAATLLGTFLVRRRRPA